MATVAQVLALVNTLNIAVTAKVTENQAATAALSAGRTARADEHQQILTAIQAMTPA